MEIQRLHEEKMLRMDARRNYLSQRSISYQSSFESRPSSLRRNQYSSNLSLHQRVPRNSEVHKKVSSSSSGDQPRVKQFLRPQSAVHQSRKKINFIQQNIQKTKKRPQSAAIIARGAPVPDVESRLKYNRNYQAPRKKKIVIKVKLGLCLLMI